jgi:hypothetical protein
MDCSTTTHPESKTAVSPKPVLGAVRVKTRLRAGALTSNHRVNVAVGVQAAPKPAPRASMKVKTTITAGVTQKGREDAP